LRGQREDLDEMLGNLLDNACKFGDLHQMPHVPYVVVAEIQVAIERKREAIYAAALLDVAQGFVSVFSAEGQERLTQPNARRKCHSRYTWHWFYFRARVDSPLSA